MDSSRLLPSAPCVPQTVKAVVTPSPKTQLLFDASSGNVLASPLNLSTASTSTQGTGRYVEGKRRRSLRFERLARRQGSAGRGGRAKTESFRRRQSGSHALQSQKALDRPRYLPPVRSVDVPDEYMTSPLPCSHPYPARRQAEETTIERSHSKHLHHDVLAATEEGMTPRPGRIATTSAAGKRTPVASRASSTAVRARWSPDDKEMATLSPRLPQEPCDHSSGSVTTHRILQEVERHIETFKLTDVASSQLWQF